MRLDAAFATTALAHDDGGRLVGVRGPGGEPQLVVARDRGRVVAIEVAGFDDVTLTVETGAHHAHPVLGDAWPIRRGDAVVAVMSALDLDRPTRIPAIDRPAALPPGTGTMLLNAIAYLAIAAEVPALRYAGPYPTAALWSSLSQCFATDGRAADFTAAPAARWAGLDRSPIPIDFAPRPFARARAAPDVYLQGRGDLERAVIAGAGYERGTGVRRLVALPRDAAAPSVDRSADGPADRSAAWAAELWFGDRRYARVATFTAGGALCDRAPLPAVTGDPVGAVLPPALVTALAELVADLVPAPLADGVAAALLATPIVWGDAGPAAAVDRTDRLVLHAALWHALAPHGRARLVLALAEALAPVAAVRVARALAAG